LFFSCRICGKKDSLLVPYKLALFGIICEPLGKMVIYVIPEAVLVSKGSNIVVSLLHHFLAKYSLGEKDGAKC